MSLLPEDDRTLEAIAADLGEVHRLLRTMAADNQAQSTAIIENQRRQVVGACSVVSSVRAAPLRAVAPRVSAQDDGYWTDF